MPLPIRILNFITRRSRRNAQQALTERHQSIYDAEKERFLQQLAQREPTHDEPAKDKQ